MAKLTIAAAAVALAALAGSARAAEPVMVQCGREYQAAKAAGTLNGMDWGAFRAACAVRLKAAPAAAPTAAAAPAPAAVPAATPSAPSPASAPTAAPSAGMAAMHARQKQCGAEWTANKATLVAATPGLTWPKYWSQCNTRIKSTGR